MNDDSEKDRGSFLRPGTKVRHDGLEEGGPEFGIVIYCWHNDEIAGYDCYVAFFGDEFPTERPKQFPYILRYAATSLQTINE